MAPTDYGQDFEDLLLMLRETRGFDFTGYKRSTLQRRMHRRMMLLNRPAFGEYRDYLGLQPEEFSLLFDSMFINVTSFFRDPLAWQALSEKVLPEILAAKNVGAPVRAWSAGCATGQEADTLAIALAEALGPDEFRRRVKVYATDLDENALQQARTGTYEAAALAEIPEQLRGAYFEPAVTCSSARPRCSSTTPTSSRRSTCPSDCSARRRRPRPDPRARPRCRT